MALIDELATVRSDGEAAFAAAVDAESLEAARVAFLGARNGRMVPLKEAFSALPGDQKRAVGKLLNEVDGALKTAFIAAKERLEAATADAPIDLTLPERSRRTVTGWSTRYCAISCAAAPSHHDRLPTGGTVRGRHSMGA